jgi:hypothetical protein
MVNFRPVRRLTGGDVVGNIWDIIVVVAHGRGDVVNGSIRIDDDLHPDNSIPILNQLFRPVRLGHVLFLVCEAYNPDIISEFAIGIPADPADEAGAVVAKTRPVSRAEVITLIPAFITS